MYINLPSVRRKKKIRKHICRQIKPRLTVYKSNKHTYAQLYNFDGSTVITSMSTLDKLFKSKLNNTENNKLNKIDQAKLVGDLLAKKIKEKQITHVVFDRSGFKFHGRIKAIAETIKSFGIIC